MATVAAEAVVADVEETKVFILSQGLENKNIEKRDKHKGIEFMKLTSFLKNSK